MSNMLQRSSNSELLGALAELGRQAADEVDPISLMGAVVEILSDTLNVDYTGIFEFLVDEDALVLRAGRGWDDDAIGETFLTNAEHPVGAVLSTQSELVINDLADEQFENDACLDRHQVASGINVLIASDGQKLGVLGVFSKKPHAIDSDILDFLNSVAYIVAVAVRRRAKEDEARQLQKLEAVGRLAAGIAHEINTPMQFVGDNLHFLQGGCAAIVEFAESISAMTPEELTVEAVSQLRQKVELDFLAGEMPVAFEQALDGVGRVVTIVRSMKAFGHPDRQDLELADLNDAIQNTLVVARNEIKYVAEVETRFAKLPLVECRLGELNQVFLNLLVNAAHAIAEVVGETGRLGRISVRTWVHASDVFIAIGDTGGGIPREVRHRVWDPFFTTKDVGKGTGQGLALARSVVAKHGGSIKFDSDTTGTIFCIRLPVRGVDTSDAISA